MKLFSLALLLSCGLWAQEHKALPQCAGGDPPSSEPCIPVMSPGKVTVTDKPVTTPTELISAPGLEKELADAKARIAWLEDKLRATEAKMQALMQFYSANDALTGLAAKEPKAK